ncbi:MULTISPECIES: carbon-nitrogen hydrolase family protein [unclassified Roseateles]|uniref:carbon-nitrogen hydrolase family protein n=1 Tax=unclassified Roseateles TaxID=2626991 RepID=UPI0006FD728B|nr:MULTISPECIES: carbon-nitrogen hydrolase family protein [unclassified Roseateles]KQW45783.1 acyltransferase [Pelomonas sp. Root405]KRA72627.1 acyltransferase [Pelomonas sp. Root662]
MKIAALQMVSGPDVAANLATARRLLEDAARRGAELAALPEYFCLMGMQDSDKIALAEVEGDGAIQAMLAAAAHDLGLWIIGGTLPIKSTTSERVRNSTLVFSPGGERVARYDKIHLFAFDNGRESYDEGRVLEPGNQPTSFDAGGVKVGLSVCYDLRFPELYRTYAGCDLLAVPAAFTYTTGQAHWELLLRARAVENQCYVVAPAQGGQHANGRRTWGHSMIVDPWGQVLSVLAEGEGAVVAEVDPARLTQVRQQLPALGHRKL